MTATLNGDFVRMIDHTLDQTPRGSVGVAIVTDKAMGAMHLEEIPDMDPPISLLLHRAHLCMQLGLA